MLRLRHLFFLTFLLLSLVSLTQAARSRILVKYLSAESLYLDAGKADGIQVGDHLTIVSVKDCRTEVEVVYVADHSASCRILSGTCSIAVGDKVEPMRPVQPDTVATLVDSVVSAPATKDTVPVSAVQETPKKKAPPKISGTLGILAYHWNDRSVSNLDFSQTTARLNFKARHLFGKDLAFSFRSRGRYDQRQRSYTSTVGKNAWENRIWEMSLSYDDPHAATTFSAGRILPRRLGSAGYLDGILIEQRLAEHLRAGLFAGNEPQWAYNEAGLALNKGGGYITVMNGEPGHSYLEQSLAFVGQYHAANISRELIASEGRYNSGTVWGYYHTAEFDLNRGWRKERAGQALTLSSIYLGTYVRISPSARFSVSYDNRKNYWTYDTRSVVDSLFDDHLRQGVRTQLDLTLPFSVQSTFSYGVNKRAGDQSTTRSYSGYLSRYGFLRKTMLVMVQYMSFRGPLENGQNYSARLTDNLSSRVQMGLAYGVYNYKVVDSDSHRSNNWFEVSSFADLTRRFFLNCSMELDSGDDIKGTRLQAEIGCRF